MFHLCGDNIDKNIKQRYFRTDKPSGTKSLHYFHYYAVKDRIDFSGMGEEPFKCSQADLKQGRCHSSQHMRMTQHYKRISVR